MNLSHKVDPYGNKNFSYEGEGILFTKDGKKHKAEFYATQLETGESLIAFSFPNNYINFDDSSKELSIEKFLGTTKENWDIKAIAPFDAVFFNPEIPSDFFGTCALFHSRKIEIIKTKKYTLDKYVFGITNFKFGITSNQEQKFSLEDGIDVNIKKKNNYSDIIHNLKISKGINVTAEIAIENSNDNGFNDITKIIDDLCYLLSLARGTKIQWVYCKEINKKGDICKVKHFNHVTKPYVFLEVIDVNSTMLISEFIDKTYNNYEDSRLKPESNSLKK
ncbi:hypothetical protein [Halanaerobium congolense]|jgi:hypothetical protein|uniref:YopA central domain-containing protein n=1 Tax=Halanaerobium congolense TaxID=54121 RepID=A0A4R7DQI7_9FIRM|nr:hypothetical protein [Halanaerobium congolense]TDS23817.1 hypothetical protein BY453_1811 [Halanaerobium congolense]